MGQIGAKLGVRVGMTMLPNGTCKAIGYISSTMSGALGGFAGDFLGDFISTTGLECMHGKVLFRGVDIRPGKLFGCGIVNDTMVFNFSGSPVAAITQYDIL